MIARFLYGQRKPATRSLRTSMEQDTDLGGPIGSFPLTQLPLVQATASPDPVQRHQALAALIECYWKPVYKYLRVKWRTSNEDAKDLTQEFFARTLEKSFFEKFDPARARFRTYLRIAVDGFASNERKAAGRQKRGGNLQGRSFDFAQAEEELLAGADYPDADLDRFFHREWVRSLFSLAVEELRGRCRESNKNLSFLLFQRYDLERASSDAAFTYEELAQEFQLPITQVTNHLAYARREFRRIVLEKLRATSASDEEFRAEARQLLGGAES
jgi:RNA polymerase sigma factor (sigma-70 family)